MTQNSSVICKVEWRTLRGRLDIFTWDWILRCRAVQIDASSVEFQRPLESMVDVLGWGRYVMVVNYLNVLASPELLGKVTTVVEKG